MTALRALAYQLQLAARDVRRNGALSIGVMVCLALGTGLWNAAVEVYHIGTQGGDQDAFYLPFAWFQRLLARPDAPVFQSPVASSFDQLLASDAIFVAYWNELPTPAHQTRVPPSVASRGL